MKERIAEFIEAHEEEMLEDAKALIAINSERMEAKPGMPFGEGAARVLEEAEKILSRRGFSSKNYDNYVITADLNDQPQRLDILAHLDVVPAGEGFTVTEPFKPLVKDGKLYGRGSADDKGPAVAALYAMRAVKELGIPLSGNCRLILGSDEECGSSDIAYYYKQEKEAPMTFSPDADFPLINVEKGGLRMQFTQEFEKQETGIRLKAITAGTKTNVVPGKAEALLDGIEKEILEAVAKEAEKETKAAFYVEEEEEGLRLRAEGSFSHAASPEKGNNALTALLCALKSVNFTDEKVRSAMVSLNRLFPHGDYYGKALGVNHEDKESGRLTLSFTILNFDGNVLSGTFDCRAPICANEENTGEVIRRKLRDAGFTPDDGRMFEAHYVPEDSTLVKTLLSCYEEITGKEGKPLITGGGTYVHHIKNGVAFGCGEEDVDNHMHGANEFMLVEQMKKSAVIFAAAIMRLCQ